MGRWIISVIVLSCMVRDAIAAGFQILEQGSRQVGNAFAGTAAIAEDASTIFFNPAGMVYLQGNQATGALTIAYPQARFENQGSTSAGGLLPTVGGNGGNGAELALVPNLYGMWDLSPTIKVGLGLSAPFGLVTDYPADWVGRYQAIRTDLFTIDIGPVIAVKLTEWLSIGGGPNIQYANAELSNAIDLGALPGGAPPQAADARVRLEADDVSASFNIGALFQPWGGTRFGLHYIHEMSHDLDGQVRYLGLNAAGAATLASLQSIGGFINQDATAPLDLPSILTFSAYHELTPTLALLADLAWADWSVFDELRVNFSRVDTILGTSSVTPEEWDDTIRIALGVLYRHDERWTFRGGVAYDETPVPDATRTPRIPDESRYWIAAGIGYRWKALEINFSYAHSFVEDATVNDTTRLRNNLVGTFDNSIDIVSIGGTLRF